MKQSIQLRMGQNLTMTPQLQQAIRLLQLSTLELKLEIQSALESNLMLELADENSEEAGTANENSEQKSGTANEDPGTTESTEITASSELSNETLNKNEIPDELPVDSVWEDVYDGATSYSQSKENDSDYLETAQNQSKSLREYLFWQLEMSKLLEKDRLIAVAIIDSVNDDGYLGSSIDEILQGLDPEHKFSVEDVEYTLGRIQRFDPPGVASRDLSECMLAQLTQLDKNTPYRLSAIDLVQSHLGNLANREFPLIMRQMKISDQDLNQIINLIQSLNPRPGSQISNKEPEYIVPDVLVKKIKGRWRVELNPDTLPKLRINNLYSGLIKRADNSEDNTYLKNHLQEARWFLKSLHSRNETLLKVASCIVERQRGFLDYGDEAMKPLVLRDVAESVEMHESTVSRVTTQKFMHTPMGIFEFKYFFSSHVGTADGGECSATAIRAIIKKFLAAENPGKPLSDSKIAELLMKQGIKVARRTVAKYRESMMIPPSNERKRLTKI